MREHRSGDACSGDDGESEETANNTLPLSCAVNLHPPSEG